MNKKAYFLIGGIVLFSLLLMLLNNNITSPSFSKTDTEYYSYQQIYNETTIPETTEEIISWANTVGIDYSNIKAVYSSGWVAGGNASRAEMIKNIKDYGFNAVVLDIKDEAGHVSYTSSVQTAIDINSSKNMIKDINQVIKDFHENDIYVIGRIVTFKDPTYAKAVKEISYKKADGTYWTDKSGNYWPNPYDKKCWDYPINLAKEAVNLGFDEIQFDYIRFPSSEGKVKQIAYGFNSDSVSKSQIINEFLTRVMDELADYKVKVSADVFGITTSHSGDYEKIGQDYKAIAQIVDVICPMIYPSHYGRGNYGVSRPDLEPYKIIRSAMEDAQRRISGDEFTAIPRPYLQDFTATWLGKGNYQIYGNEAVRDQIKACYDLEIPSFTLWDPSNKYCFEALTLASKSGD